MHLAVGVSSLHVDFGEVRAVRGVSLQVAGGERVALIGPSGAGKTTVMRVVAGLEQPTSGSVSVLGQPRHALHGRANRRLCARVGMVHQQLLLTPSLRVVHNVNAGLLGSWSIGRALRSLAWPVGEDEARAALDRVGIGEKLRERTDSLSGGQQQRVALARVLVQKPELLLADEPVSAVDPAWSERMLQVLTDEVQERNAGLLVVLHDVELALRFCDRIVGMRDGAVVFDRRPRELDPATIDELYAISQ
jgi:phosphonate transport system ATP-binding protein